MRFVAGTMLLLLQLLPLCLRSRVQVWLLALVLIHRFLEGVLILMMVEVGVVVMQGADGGDMCDPVTRSKHSNVVVVFACSFACVCVCVCVCVRVCV